MEDFSSIYGELEDIIGGEEYTNDLERLLSESLSDDQLLQELLSDQREAIKSQSSSLNTSATSENGGEEEFTKTTETQNSSATELSTSIQNEVQSQTVEEFATKEENDLQSKPPPLPMKPPELTPRGERNQSKDHFSLIEVLTT